VTTDIVEAQKVMRDKLADASLVLLMGTVLHSLAVANMLGPTVKTVCVDIDPSAVARVIEREPFQSIGVVTDVEPFLRQLTDSLIDSDGEAAKRRPEKK